MSTTDEAPQTEVEPKEQGNASEQTTEDHEAQEKAPASDGIDSLPESWQSEIRTLRSENARRRTSENELKSQLEKAKSQEDIDAAVAEYQSTVKKLELDLAREKHTRDLPPELIEFVTGESDEEIKASAEKLRTVFQSQQSKKQSGDPRGGMDPSDTDGALDPAAYAKAARAQSRRF